MTHALAGIHICRLSLKGVDIKIVFHEVFEVDTPSLCVLPSY